jgi:hypothetical protein
VRNIKQFIGDRRQNLHLSHYQLGAFAVVFAVVGSFLLFVSHAATPAASVETESGTVTAPAIRVSDSTASGGSAVKFAGATGVPAQCANGGNYLWSNLETCGWPGPANTGAVASQCPGGVLTDVGSSQTAKTTISTAGTTLSCQNITGCLYITAANVTITNVKITCSSGKTGTNANATAAIFIENGASATISRTEIDGTNKNHSCIWHEGTSMTVTAVNCSHVDDGIFSWADSSSATSGDHFTIQDSYLHDFTVATANGHIDGYQTEGAGDGLISHNTFLMTSDDGNSTSGAISIWNSLKSSHDITVQNNLITGGGFAIYAEDYDPSEASPSGGFSVTNIIFNNNSFSTRLFGGTCVGYYGVWYPRGSPTDAWHRSGNKVLETGFNLDNSNPPGCN